VTVLAQLPHGLLESFKTFNQADPGGSPTNSEGGIFHACVLRPYRQLGRVQGRL
jgi:hypothetical protein